MRVTTHRAVVVVLVGLFDVVNKTSARAVVVVLVMWVVVEKNTRTATTNAVVVAAVETASCRSCRSSATCTMQGNSRMSSMREV